MTEEQERRAEVDRIVTEMRVLAPPRRCLWILETEYDRDGGYVPVMITEGEPGYSPMRGIGPLAAPWYWGHDLAVAKRIADEANAELGLSHEQALKIVLSSMAAQTPPAPSGT